MPESYTGTEGNDALAAGFAVMDGGEDRRDGWRAINKTRDLVAQLKTWVTAQLAAIDISWGSITGKPAVIAAGASQAAARAAIDAPANNHTHEQILNSTHVFGFNANVGGSPGFVSNRNVAIDGHLFLPNAAPAVSAYTIAYVDGTGRLSKGASSERYKDEITAVDPLELGDLFTGLYRYKMIDGDGSWRFGDIAERLAENPATASFVVTDLSGRPESVDFIGILTARVGWLHAQNSALAARVEALEAAS